MPVKGKLKGKNQKVGDKPIKRTGLAVRPYGEKSVWKNGGKFKGETGVLPVIVTEKEVKPSEKHKWYLGIDGLVHIVRVGKYGKVEPVCEPFKEGKGTRLQDALLKTASEDSSLVS